MAIGAQLQLDHQLHQRIVSRFTNRFTSTYSRSARSHEPSRSQGHWMPSTPPQDQQWHPSCIDGHRLCGRWRDGQPMPELVIHCLGAATTVACMMSTTANNVRGATEFEAMQRTRNSETNGYGFVHKSPNHPQMIFISRETNQLWHGGTPL